jgi:anthranilate 1,2-dioxygenase ferredoxin component
MGRVVVQDYSTTGTAPAGTQRQTHITTGHAAPVSESAWQRVLPVEELPEDRPLIKEVAGTLVMLVRIGWDVFAVHALCPHKFTPLEEGEIHDGRVVCARHNAMFDLETGTPAPGCEWAGTLPVFEARVRDGQVEVQLRALGDA